MTPSRLTRYLAAFVAVLVLVAVVGTIGLPIAHALPLGFAAVGAVTTTTDLDALLKIQFSDSPVTNTVTDSEFFDLVAMDPKVKHDETTGGRYIETAQMFALPAGHGARREGDALPIPNGPTVANSKIFLPSLYGTLSMNGAVMRRVRTDEGAYLDYLERSLPSLVTRQTNDVDRMAIGYGMGSKAKVSALPGAGGGGQLITLKDGHGITGYGEAWVNFLAGEQIVAATDVIGTAFRANSMRVQDVLPDTNQIVVDALATALAVNDHLFEGDASGNSSSTTGAAREFMGLLGHVDDGSVVATYQTLSRTTYNQWRGTVVDASAFSAPLTAGQLDQDALMLADDKTAVQGGGKPNLIVASRHSQRAFWRSIRNSRQMPMISPKKYVGGKGELSIMLGDREVEVRASRKVPPNICFGLQTDTLTRHELGKLEWDDTTGSIWKQGFVGSAYADQFFAYNYRYLQMSCKAPRKNFVIRGLTQTA